MSAVGTEDVEGQKLSYSVLHSVQAIAKAEGEKHGFVVQDAAISALAQLVEQYTTQVFGPDLAAFTRHAKRSTICPDDVKLCARKDQHVLTALEDFEAEYITAAKQVKRRRRLESKSKQRSAGSGGGSGGGGTTGGPSRSGSSGAASSAATGFSGSRGGDGSSAHRTAGSTAGAAGAGAGAGSGGGSGTPGRASSSRDGGADPFAVPTSARIRTSGSSAGGRLSARTGTVGRSIPLASGGRREGSTRLDGGSEAAGAGSAAGRRSGPANYKLAASRALGGVSTRPVVVDTLDDNSGGLGEWD